MFLHLSTMGQEDFCFAAAAGSGHWYWSLPGLFLPAVGVLCADTRFVSIQVGLFGGWSS